MRGLEHNDYTLLGEVARHGVVHFDWEPSPTKAHAELVYSTLAPFEQVRLHDLAVKGYVAESVGSVHDGRHLPITRTAYSLTAYGRHATGLRQPLMPPKHRCQYGDDCETCV